MDKNFNKIYEMARLLVNPESSFEAHLVPVARTSRFYAKQFNASADICELGGLLHDIGYGPNYEPSKENHIENGIVIASKILNGVGIDEDYARRIVDCIRTHDNHLVPGSPLENIIVHDSDLIVAMDSIASNLDLMKGWGVPYFDALDRIEKDVQKKMTWIHHPYFKELAMSKQPKFNAELNTMRRLIR